MVKFPSSSINPYSRHFRMESHHMRQGLLHPAILSLLTKLKILKPELEVPFKPTRCHSIKLNNATNSSKVRHRFLHLLVSLLLKLTRNRLPPQKPKPIKLLLVLNVLQKIVLQRTRPLKPILEFPPGFDDFGYLSPVK
uniref:Uncharacterized protein n=1 Tax=Opuntia streptacantha TaxID=393608 RepID=A0A7C8Z6I2_OPUST